MEARKMRLASFEYLDSDYIKKTRSLTIDFTSKKKSVGIQSIVPPKQYVPPHILASHKLSMIDFPKILYMPHTIMFMFLITTLFLSYAFQKSIEVTTYEQRVKYGIISLFFMIIFIAAVHFPDTLLNRPHPIVWRIILGMFLCYTISIGFLHFQTLDDARQIFKYIDPQLGVSLPEKQYAADCRVFTPENPESYFYNVWQNLDVYIWSHFIGWVIYMVSLRDKLLCWAISLLFETTELTFKHWLPNYEECWWDSLILDVLICNGLGIEVGGLICKYFEIKSFQWMVDDSKPKHSKLYSVTHLFKPYVWTKYNWKMFSSLRRYIYLVWFIIFSVLVQNTNFFLKYLLWIPSSHNLLLTRVLTWGGMGMIATTDYYYYVENTHMRMGTGIWLTHFTLFLEIGLLWKWGRNIFVAPFKPCIIVYWACMVVLIALGGLYIWKKDTVNNTAYDPYNPPLDISEDR